MLKLSLAQNKVACSFALWPSNCVSLYLCIWIYLAVLCLQLYLCTFVFVHMCICAFVYFCTCVLVHLCICAFVYFCTCVFVQMVVQFAWLQFWLDPDETLEVSGSSLKELDLPILCCWGWGGGSPGIWPMKLNLAKFSVCFWPMSQRQMLDFCQYCAGDEEKAVSSSEPWS